MIEIKDGTLEARIIRVLREVYPITIEALAKELKQQPGIVERGVKKLASRGIVQLETLPGATYIRLARSDIHFVGRNPNQKRKLKHRGSKKGSGPEKYDGDMFG